MKFKNLLFIAFQDLVLDYKNTKISFFWLPISFLILIFAKILFLGDILGDNKNYIIYLSLGLWIWQYISSSITSYGKSLYNNKVLLNIKIKPMNFVWITFLRMKIIIILNLFILILFLISYSEEIHFLGFLFSLILIIFNMYQVGKILSIISIYIRDINMMINGFLIVVFYLSPIFWYPEKLSPEKQLLLNYNPIFHVLNIIRDPILHGTINFYSFKIILVIAIILFVINFFFTNNVIKKITTKL